MRVGGGVRLSSHHLKVGLKLEISGIYTLPFLEVRTYAEDPPTPLKRGLSEFPPF